MNSLSKSEWMHPLSEMDNAAPASEDGRLWTPEVRHLTKATGQIVNPQAMSPKNLARLFKEGFRSALEDRKEQVLTSGGDSELSLALRLAGWDLSSRPEMQLKHFVRAGKLDWRYLRQLHRGLGQTKPILEVYRNANLPQQAAGGIRRYWTRKAMRLLRSILAQDRRTLEKFRQSLEGDPAVLELESKIGHFTELLSLQSRLAVIDSQISGANFRKESILPPTEQILEAQTESREQFTLPIELKAELKKRVQTGKRVSASIRKPKVPRRVKDHKASARVQTGKASPRVEGHKVSPRRSHNKVSERVISPKVSASIQDQKARVSNPKVSPRVRNQKASRSVPNRQVSASAPRSSARVSDGKASQRVLDQRISPLVSNPEVTPLLPGQTVPSPVAEPKVSVPAPDEKAAVSVPDAEVSQIVSEDKACLRMKEQEDSVVVADEKGSANVPDPIFFAPVFDERTLAPVAERDVPAPAPEEKASPPVPPEKVLAPAAEFEATPLILEDEVSVPEPDPEVSVPVPEQKVSAPVADERFSSPVSDQRVFQRVPDREVSVRLPEHRVSGSGPSFPPPLLGREGWPWQNVARTADPGLQERNGWPRITVATPSFNQGRFLEETIRSVLLQGYPNLEYIVIDGGSRDNSVEIIRKYEPWLAYWVSEKDNGQSHAINKGWQRATGDLISYLNSDDTLLPEALFKVAKAWQQYPRAVAVVGATHCTDGESNNVVTTAIPKLPGSAPLDLTLLDNESWLLPQQSGFWSRQALDQVGRWVREDLLYTMDRELYYRVCMQGKLTLLSEPLATYRFHETSKSVSAILSMYGEDPKALAYCTWGGPEAQKRRHKVGKWRMGQGHFRFGRSSESKAFRLQHLFLAAIYRPGYLRRRRFWAAALEALGLKGRGRHIQRASVTRVL